MGIDYVKGESVFTKTNRHIKQYEYLTQNIDTDVIIVGGGITGSILGYYFSKNNIDAVILEKGRIAHGSTSIVTALLEYQLDNIAMELKSYFSIEDILGIYKLGLKALSEVEDFVHEHENNCDFRRTDSLLYTPKDIEKKLLKEEFEIRKNNGFNVEYIDERNNPFLFDVKAGILSKNGGGKFDPYKFSHELLRISSEKGLRVYENSGVKNVEYTNDGVIAETVYGYKVNGKIIIVATGYDTELFTKRAFGTKYTTFSIATKPINNIDEVYNSLVVRDKNVPYNYIRTTEDKRIIIGGEDVSFTPEINNEKLRNEKYNILEQRLKNIFNNLNIEIEYKFCGAFATTKDNLGFIGKDPNNSKLWYCLGYGANGILFDILGGMMLSKLYLGEEDENLKLFKVGRFDAAPKTF